MRGGAWYTSLRILSYLVLAAMTGALLYASWISMTHWSGIGV
ncbi:MAG TPA: hypothetical protein VK025_08030 [Steroidobacter sp.]|jgi:hypothetical protein|nr:hypothetical protein [Steroidobacteraceae bacterium]HLS81336.1 hypothetical protein [Steroidobacter sp.]